MGIFSALSGTALVSSVLRVAGRMKMFGDELLAFVVQQCTGDQTRFAEHLETVAYPEHQAALLGMLPPPPA
jgi:hypothetical protein